MLEAPKRFVFDGVRIDLIVVLDHNGARTTCSIYMKISCIYIRALTRICIGAAGGDRLTHPALRSNNPTARAHAPPITATLRRKKWMSKSIV